jgi:membrane protease YdiL (CAAX protease family)
MAAHSDSSSDSDPTQAIGRPAGGAHAAAAGPTGSPADRTVPVTERTTPAAPVTDRTAPVGSEDTTTVHPTVDRTTTIPTTTVPPGTGAGAGAAAELTGRPDGDRDTDRGRGAPRVERQQIVAAQKARYGGISWGAAFFGWLSANGMAVILIALLSAAGLAFGLSSQVDSADEAARSATTGIGLGAGIALLVALFLAYLAGGYVAGRMARFDGVKQGIAVWVIGLVVVVLLALAGVLFGSQYNVLSQLDLPRIPVDEGTATTAGIIALVAVLVATLGGAVLGGVLGARYHRKVDRVGFDAL